MQGRRLADHFDQAPDFTWEQVKPGDYFKVAPGHWFLCAPSGEHGAATDGIWTITEHENGSITVSPSLWFNKARGGWHGYLVEGVWRPVS